MASVAYADVLLLSDRLEECGPEAVISPSLPGRRRRLLHGPRGASGARWRDHRSATHLHDDEVEIWQHEALKR
ncbi:hypothetical protein ABID65_008178 [Bradyrhizobium sp. S3.9.2]|uniref:hypothetical protein n=1 Tax=Bradyrhizobium sp. S3.9.2 TaxID=3156432 RepID=UPI0033979445